MPNYVNDLTMQQILACLQSPIAFSYFLFFFNVLYFLFFLHVLYFLFFLHVLYFLFCLQMCKGDQSVKSEREEENSSLLAELKMANPEKFKRSVD